MIAKSTRLFPAILTLKADKVVQRGRKRVATTLLMEREEIGMHEEQEGSCTVANSIKVANVFGQYTSLETHISVSFPCDTDNFESEAIRFQDRITAAIQAFQNRVLERVGVDKIWHGNEPPVLPSEKSTQGKNPRKKVAKKKASSAKKRTPRKR